MRGEVLADLGEGNKAISDLNQVAPDVPSSQAARGLALAETGDHTAAAAEINGALANARRSGLVLLYAARASDLAGDNVSAKERAREAIDATDPPLSPPHKQLALAWPAEKEILRPLSGALLKLFERGPSRILECLNTVVELPEVTGNQR